MALEWHNSECSRDDVLASIQHAEKVIQDAKILVRLEMSLQTWSWAGPVIWPQMEDQGVRLSIKDDVPHGIVRGRFSDGEIMMFDLNRDG